MAHPQIQAEVIQTQLPSTLEDSCSLFAQPYEERTDDENNALLSLLKKIPCFQNSAAQIFSKKENAISFLKLFSHEVYSKGQAIYHYGELPRRFWIILKGTTRLYIPKEIDHILEDENEHRHHRLTSMESTVTFAEHDSLPMKRSTMKVPTKTKESLKSIEAISGNSSPMGKSQARRNKGFGRDTVARNLHTIEGDGNGFSNPGEEGQEKEGEEILESSKVFRNSKASSDHFDEEVEIFKKFKKPKKYFIGDHEMSFQSERILASGNSFDDLMIVNPLSQYQNTLVAWDDVHIISISMKQYLQDCKESANYLKENLAFLEKTFPDLTPKVLMPLASSAEKKTFRKGEIIFQEGSDCGHLSIIQKGDVELMKNIPEEVNKKPQHEHDLNLKTKGKTNAPTTMLLLSDGQLLGEESLLERDQYFFTTKVKTAEVIIFMIPKTSLNMLASLNSYYFSFITQTVQINYKAKISRYMETIEELKVSRELLEKLTHKELEEQDNVKSALNYYARAKRQEMKPKVQVTTAHVRSGEPESVTKLNEEASKQLQKLAETKAKTIKNINKIDKGAGHDHGTPKSPTKKPEEGDQQGDVASSRSSLQLSLWDQSLKGSWFSRRVKGLETKEKNEPTSATVSRNKKSFSPQPNPKGETDEIRLKQKEVSEKVRKVLESHVQGGQRELCPAQYLPMAIGSYSENVDEGSTAKKNISDQIGILEGAHDVSPLIAERKARRFGKFEQMRNEFKNQKNIQFAKSVDAKGLSSQLSQINNFNFNLNQQQITTSSLKGCEEVPDLKGKSYSDIRMKLHLAKKKRENFEDNMKIEVKDDKGLTIVVNKVEQRFEDQSSPRKTIQEPGFKVERSPAKEFKIRSSRKPPQKGSPFLQTKGGEEKDLILELQIKSPLKQKLNPFSQTLTGEETKSPFKPNLFAKTVKNGEELKDGFQFQKTPLQKKFGKSQHNMFRITKGKV